jgi:hypothetical protein
LAVPPAAGVSGSPTKDTIFVRKILMDAIDMTMDEIETMLAPDGKLDAAEVRERADIISIMRARRQQMRTKAPRYMPRDSRVLSKIRRSSQGDQLSM